MHPPAQRYLAYVEDDEEDVELFQEVAETLRLKVQAFPNGQELLRFLHLHPEAPPGLILLDLKNPVISGPETYALLQADERFRLIPVKYFSSSMELMEREVLHSPGVELIAKPDVYSEWVRLVTRLAGLCGETPSESSVG